MIHASARTIFAAAAIALSCGAAAADKKSDGKLSSSDRQFITTVAQDGMAEVELGKLAQEKASSADVKQFAQRMVNDHSKSSTEMLPSPRLEMHNTFESRLTYSPCAPLPVGMKPMSLNDSPSIMWTPLESMSAA